MLQSGVPVNWFRGHLAAAARAGLDTDALILKHTSPDLDLDSDAGLNWLERLTIILDMIISLGDESHGYGDKPVAVGFNSMMLRSMMSADSVGSALDLATRFMRVMGGPLQMFVKTEAGYVDLFLRVVNSEAGAPSYEEICALWTGKCLSWLADEELRPLAVLTSDPTHPCLNRRHWLTNAPVRLSRGVGIRYPRSILALPVVERSDNHPTLSLHKYFMETPVMAARGPLQSIARQAMPSLDATVQVTDLCSELSISASTLRRRLHAEGGNFRALRQEALVTAVCERLMLVDETGDELAEHLGFAEGRSLRRMIKSATGLTLQELRAKVKAPEESFDRAHLRVRCLRFAQLLDS